MYDRKSINGYLMSKDTVVGIVKDGDLRITNHNLAPLYLQKYNDFEKWLSDRAIDEHRTNSRLLKKALRLKEKDNVSTTLSVHATTITDNYWFCSVNENLKWDDVRFKENFFDELALKGSFISFEQKPSRTPELTNGGSFEKCWRQENNNWWLYKTGNEREYFSELLVCHIGEKLGFDMAHYELSDDNFIKSLDFTNNNQYNFEHIKAFVGDDEDYALSFNALYKISPEIAKDYLKIIYLDAVCYNPDRHTENYGILRDANTGEIVKLAPNYDNNLSLVSKEQNLQSSRENNRLINDFVELLSNVPEARKLYNELNIPEITHEMLDECISKIPINIDVNLDELKEFIIRGQDVIKTKELEIDNILTDTSELFEIDIIAKVNKAVEKALNAPDLDEVRDNTSIITPSDSFDEPD